MNRFDSIKIKGGYFDTPCNINFYKINKDNKNKKNNKKQINGRVVLIYGENGSGKTSIANAISRQHVEESEYVLNYYKEQKPLMDYKISPKNIFVYNEEFTNGKVMYDEKNLKAIVMFGKQVEIDDKLKKLFEKKRNLEENLKQEEEKLNNNDSDQQFEFLKTTLQKDGGWADLEKQIQGKTQKASVTKKNIDDIFEEYGKEDNTDLDDLRKEFHSKFSLFTNQIRENAECLDRIVIPSVEREIIEEIVTLLKKEYKQPINDNTLKWLEKQLKHRGIEFYREVKKVMSSENEDRCPFCLQKIDSTQKETVLRQLNKLLDDSIKELNKKIDEYIEFLKISKIESIKVEKYRNLGDESINKIHQINDEIKDFNDKLEDLKIKLEEKKDKPFLILELPELPNIEIYDKVDEINQLIDTYNEGLSNIEKTKEELSKLNKKIVAREYGEHYKLYKVIMKQIETIRKNIDKIKKEIIKCNQKIDELNHEKKNTKIALEIINDYLSFIFWDKDRLKLKPSKDEGYYEVWSKGVHVELSKLSIAERNIISLCYFFSTLKEERGLDDKTSKLIVIDDPVSSFDSQNKVGIISFLKSRIKGLIEENTSNKLILLTHDMYTMLQIQKSLDDINSQIINQIKYFIYHLRDKQLKNMNVEKYNYISELICTSAYFAFGEDSDYLGINIGNMLRRIIEGYSNFNYKYSVTDIFNKSEISAKLNKQRIEYYQDKMFRLFLHGESHLEDQIRTGVGNENELFISLEEKKNLSRDILCFLYEIDELFLKRHLAQIAAFTNNKLNDTKVLKHIKEHLEKIQV